MQKLGWNCVLKRPAQIPFGMANPSQRIPAGESLAKLGAGKIPIEKLIQIQSLCDRGRSDAEISRLSGLPESVIEIVIHNENWRESRILSEAEKATQDEKRKAHLLRWERAVGAQARLLALRGLDATSDCLDEGNVRNAKDAATVAKLMSDLARVSEGMDTKSNLSPDAGINFFFIEAPERNDKVVTTDVVDV